MKMQRMRNFVEFIVNIELNQAAVLDFQSMNALADCDIVISKASIIHAIIIVAEH